MELITGILVVAALWFGSETKTHVDKPYFKLSEIESQAKQACGSDKFQIDRDGFVYDNNEFRYFKCL